METVPEIFQCFLPAPWFPKYSDTGILWGLYQGILVSENLQLRKIGLVYLLSVWKTQPLQQFLLKRDKWFSLNACVFHNNNPWICFSPLLGLQEPEVWKMSWKRKPPELALKTVSVVIRHRLRDLELHSLWKTISSLFRGKGNEIFGKPWGGEKTSIISRIFFFGTSHFTIPPGFPTQTWMRTVVWRLNGLSSQARNVVIFPTESAEPWNSYLLFEHFFFTIRWWST